MSGRLVIYGTGGFGREVLTIARDILQVEHRRSNPRFQKLVFCDDDWAVASEVLGIEVVSPETMGDGDYFTLAIGSGEARKRLHSDCIARGATPMTIKAQNARFGDGVSIGEGAVFSDFTMVTGSARIGQQFQCNIYSYVAHDCIVGDFVTFAPRVCCNGNISVGDYAYVGTGAVLKQGTPEKPLRIGAGAIIGMGAVVTKDVPAGATVVGNPAKPLGSS